MASAIPPQSPNASDPKADKAKAILSGAFEVFTTQGYAAASMARIAKAAGVSKPTLYSYFQDKEGLFIALVQQLLHKSTRTVGQLPGEANFPDSPEAIMRQMATSFLREAANNKPFLTLMRLIIGESEKFPELAQTFVRELSKPMLERMTTYLGNHPQLHFSDPEVAARMFAGSMVYYLIVQEIMGGKKIIPMECDRMVAGLVDIMMAGGHYEA
ncbi:MAG: TetR/AcrR family transcriptional regulator [Cyanobacteria bacterium P01_H01_bin.21]